MGLAEHNPVFLASASIALAALLASTGQLAVAFAREAASNAESRSLRDVVLLAGTANLIWLGLAAIVWQGADLIPFALIPYFVGVGLTSKLDEMVVTGEDSTINVAHGATWLGSLSGIFLLVLPSLADWPLLGPSALVVVIMLCVGVNSSDLDKFVRNQLNQTAKRHPFQTAWKSAFLPQSFLILFMAIYVSGQTRSAGETGQELFVAVTASILAASAWHATAIILQRLGSDAGEFLRRLGVSVACLGMILVGLPNSAVSVSVWTMEGIASALFGLLLIFLLFASVMHWFWRGRGATWRYHSLCFIALIALLLTFNACLPAIQAASDFERLAGTSVLCLLFASMPQNWYAQLGHWITGTPVNRRARDCTGT